MTNAADVLKNERPECGVRRRFSARQAQKPARQTSAIILPSSRRLGTGFPRGACCA